MDGEQSMTGWQDLLQDVLAGMQEWQAAHPKATFAEIERAVEERVAALRAQFIQDLVATRAAAEVASQPVGERPHCPDCGELMESRGQRDRVVTVPGNRPVRLRRSYVVCPTCGWGFSPLDQELELPAGSLSPRLAESAVLLGTLIAFEQVPATLAFFTRVKIDEETTRRRTEAAGAALVQVETAEAERILRECPPAPPGPALQQVSADGAMVPLVHGEWAEVKTLVIGTVGERVTAHGGRLPHTGELSYFSRLTNADTFTRLAVGEIHRRGTERAGEVCAVMDGAEWLQRLVDVHRPDAVRILDFPHAAEHVSKAAHAVFGAGTAAASEWLGVQLHELKHGDPDQVLAALRALPVETADQPEDAEAVREAVVGYLEKRRDQIEYAQFLQRGYPIGSGIAESANKVVVEARLKGSGMHWARTNVDSMLALRAAVRSGRWTQAWEQITGFFRCEAASRRCQRREERHPAGQQAPPVCPPDQPPAAPCAQRAAATRPQPKGLMKNGRPTKNHPWKQGAVSRRQRANPSGAKL